MTKRSYLRIVITVLILCVLIGSGVAAFFFLRNPDPTTASINIEFSFQGASDSLAPSGVRFDPEEIRSDAILQPALASAGLEGKYTPEQIRGSLKVSGIYPEDFIEQVKSFRSLLNLESSTGNLLTSYHPTQFSVTLTNEFDRTIPAQSQNALLEAILATYVSSFKEKYGAYLDTQVYEDLFSGTDADFVQQLEAIDREISHLQLYAQEMAERSADVRVDGRGFDDIAVRLRSLSESTVAQLKANLQVNGLAKNPQRLLNQYAYTSQRLLIRLDVQRQHLKNLDKLIASFERNGTIYMTANNGTQAFDGNSSVTYDKLVNVRNKLTEKIYTVSNQSASYQKWIDALSDKDDGAPDLKDLFGTGSDNPASAAASDETDAVDRISDTQITAFQLQIDSIREVMNQIIADFKTLLAAFNEARINPGTVTVSAIHYEAPTLLSLRFIKQAVKTSAPFAVAGFILCLIILLPKMKKRYLH